MSHISIFCRYEQRLQNAREPQTPDSGLHLRLSRTISSGRSRPIVNAGASRQEQLIQFIREERNHQQFRLERNTEPINSASPEFIANFRMEQQSNKTLIDSTMAEQDLRCTICMSTFELDDAYATWPCTSRTPHIYHSHCMLNWLRRKNTCPICRHPVTPARISQATFGQFMIRLIF